MINLTNINIEFDKKVIENGEITIHDAGITVITGKSGSGKTSLLNLLGMISSNCTYQYKFDGMTVDLRKDAAVSQIRKSRIGYIFQDNTLIDSLSVLDNIQLAAQLAGWPVSASEIEDHPDSFYHQFRRFCCPDICHQQALQLHFDSVRLAHSSDAIGDHHSRDYRSDVSQRDLDESL